MKKMLWTITLASMASVFAPPAPAGQLHVMPRDGAQATGMASDASVVVATATAGPFAPAQAMAWHVDTGETFALPGMDAAYGVNDAGSIVGTLGIDGGTNQGGSDHAAVWAADARQARPLLPEPAGADSTFGYAISGEGDVVGSYYTTAGANRAVFWKVGSTMKNLPVRDAAFPSAAYAISRAADVDGGHTIAGFVGSGDAFGTQNGVVWLGPQLVPHFPVNAEGHAVGPALATSSDGRYVVGAIYDTATTGHAFDAWRWDASTGAVTRIPGMDTAQAVSLDGDMVLGTRGFPTRVAMIWRVGVGTVTLRDFLEEKDVPRPDGWVKPEGALNLMSDDGTVIGGCCVPMDDGSLGHSYLVSGAPIGADRIFANDFEEAAISEDTVADGGFEGTLDNGGVNPAWTSTDGNPDAPPGGTVFFDESRFVGSAARHGLWMALFGGYRNGAAEVQTMEQSVWFPRGSALRLRYGYYVALNADAPARMEVTVDGHVVDSIDMQAEPPMRDYARRTIDLTAFADNAKHDVLFRFEYMGGEASEGELLIDDVQVGTVGTVKGGVQ